MTTSPFRLELTVARERYGFYRTLCDCELCRVPCRHMPGSLDVADLPLLCPADQDVFTWAEQHLRALTDKPVPTLVPARQANGHCHWLEQDRCTVHEVSPFGCAFFDSHMSAAEARRRSAATLQARQHDADRHGLYYRVWLHLCQKGLVGRPGDREAVGRERQAIWQRMLHSRSPRRSAAEGDPAGPFFDGFPS
jgi:hypothetical protein